VLLGCLFGVNGHAPLFYGDLHLTPWVGTHVERRPTDVNGRVRGLHEKRPRGIGRDVEVGLAGQVHNSLSVVKSLRKAELAVRMDLYACAVGQLEGRPLSLVGFHDAILGPRSVPGVLVPQVRASEEEAADHDA
jgi:hypothetical protein